MKLLPRLAIVLALCLMAIALLPLPAQAGCRFPEISLSPDQGLPGVSVTVSGVDFERDRYVDIYYDGTWLDHVLPDPFTGNFEVTITIPKSPTGRHKIRAESAFDDEEATFTVRPGVVVSPTEGRAGTEVAVEGRGFGADETGIEVRYYFNGTYETVADNIKADANGSWEASFAIPPSAGGEYRISARGSTTAFIQAVRHATFWIRPEISMAETSGAAGQHIPVSGSGFAADERNIRILLDGEAVPTVPAEVTASATGYWEASFVVPGKPAGEYSVTAEGDVTRRRDVADLSLQIGPGIVLSHGEGHVGMNVTVAGQGFPTDKAVAIFYNGGQVATTTTDGEGRFVGVSFSVPESRHGEQEVMAVVTDGTNSTAGVGTNATATFVMESNHPKTPDLISPTDGHRVGRLFKVRPTFEWSEVFDDSGVYYHLQVATSADLAPASVVLSVNGLTETSYTVSEAEALPNGTYYWAVQAIDGAENESGWAGAESFRAGRLPLWAFIVIISFLALLLGLRTYFILVRPKLYE